MERIFTSFKGDSRSVPTSYDPGDPESYIQFVHALIADSKDYEQSILAPIRDQYTKYYYGLLPTLNRGESAYSSPMIITDPNATYDDILDPYENPNKSTYVSTDVRDAVLMMLPSLIRIFAGSENVVDIVPNNGNDTAMAEQATDYTNYTFWHDNPGFLILYGAFKDAMTVKTGYVKWYTDDNKQVATKTFVNISAEQLQMIIAEQPGTTVVHSEQPDPQTQLIPSVTVKYEVSKPIIRVAGVPPEEMRLDRYARSWNKARIVGHERVVPIDELTAMGYDREVLQNYVQTTDQTYNFTQEAQIRNPGRAMSTRMGDGINYGEWYVWIDQDGDGVPELHYICTMGNDHEIVSDEPANRIKFACFSVDPIAHTIVGDSIADITYDIQRIKTNMFRGVLDSLAESINPKMAINELITNMEDAMNDDLGAIIRTRGDPSAAVSYTSTPFVGQQAIPILELLDSVLQRRTGLSDAAKGLDPKALQSSTMIGVDAVISGAQERIELVARVLCETGFKDLFQGLFNEICENPNQQRVLKIRGNFVPFDTSVFDATMRVEVNPTLGKGTDFVRMMTLQQIKQDQQTLVSQMGLNNPVCGVVEMLNTISDMLEISNIKNVGRYFKTPPPQVIQAMQSAPKEPDPMSVAAKAQMEKVKSDTAQAVSQQQQAEEKLQSDDAFRRDKLQAWQDVEAQKLQQQEQKIQLDHEAQMAKAAAQVAAAEAKPKPNGGA